MLKLRLPVMVLVLVAGTSCGKEKDNPTPPPPGAEGLHKTDQGWVLRTSELNAGLGEERYYCYAIVTSQDLKINRFSFSKTAGVHHFMFNETSEPQTEGLSECNIFRVTGETLFTATTASVELATPTGSAKLVAAGTSLVLQTHLLNTTEAPIKSVLEIRMTESPDADPELVGTLAFGSANITLPPNQVTTVESGCRIDEDARFYAIVPHMHYLGRRVELAFGAEPDSLETVYVRDPFSFDDQRFDAFERTVPAGTYARVRCIYDNMTNETVRFGESATDEMCNVPAFIVGRPGIKLCTRALPPDASVPRDPDAGACGSHVSPSGIGQICSPGSACGEGLVCSADYLNMPLGICARIGCTSNSDCEGTTCCTVADVSGLANFCVPEGCRPEQCIPVSSY